MPGLLTGAARAFADHGLRRSTMQSIAAAAGVAKATLYNHFRTKDEVAAALLAGRARPAEAQLAATLPREQALAALSDELGAHPVLRRLAATEPETLAWLLAVSTRAVGGADRHGWARPCAWTRTAPSWPARWLLGVVLQPGRSTTRHRHARPPGRRLA